MTYDPTVPGPAQRISDTQLPIQLNFEFIENGDSSFKPKAINLDNRTPLAASNDPTAVPNSYILYCKEDSGGNPEFFGRDEAGVISQFTSTDRTIAETGHVLLAPGFGLQWGRDTMLSGTSLLTVTFPKAFTGTVFMVNTTPYAATFLIAGSREWGANNLTDTTFDARSFGGNVPQDTEFGWLALGPL